jgi:guanine deaminase
VIHAQGQRAFIGKVNMDRNSPAHYTETTASSQSTTTAFLNYLTQDLSSDLLTPILTPRFAPSCTPELMAWLGEKAKEGGWPVQSHLAENLEEIAWVKELHPEAESYTGVYEYYGLLTDRTVMAHCVHVCCVFLYYTHLFSL